jgi:sigma-54 dependent transcriptional regulator, acetoin dehydrogenase operon transcriptional activator AcoR
MPETLVEAELFGYAEGAFTGAQRKGRIGRVREANGGVLFLDEIGDMPLTLQPRLLRVLQERKVTPRSAANGASRSMTSPGSASATSVRSALASDRFSGQFAQGGRWRG